MSIVFVQVQLVRIQLRVPEYGWTTQKVFHLLNALVCSLRCGSFLFRGQMQQLHPDAVRLVLFDLPGMWQPSVAAVGTDRHSAPEPPPMQLVRAVHGTVVVPTAEHHSSYPSVALHTCI